MQIDSFTSFFWSLWFLFAFSYLITVARTSSIITECVCWEQSRGHCIIPYIGGGGSIQSFNIWWYNFMCFCCWVFFLISLADWTYSFLSLVCWDSKNHEWLLHFVKWSKCFFHVYCNNHVIFFYSVNNATYCFSKPTMSSWDNSHMVILSSLYMVIFC